MIPGFVEPCLPSPAEQLPSGPDWVQEIKHDGYRLMARRVLFNPGSQNLPRRGIKKSFYRVECLNCRVLSPRFQSTEQQSIARPHH